MVKKEKTQVNQGQIIQQSKETKESSLEDVKLFLSKKLNFSEKGIKAIEDLGVDSGEALFLLNEEDIDSNEDLSDEEKDNLKNFLNQEKEREKVDEQDENKEEKKENRLRTNHT